MADLPTQPVLHISSPSPATQKGKKHTTQRNRVYNGERVTNALYNGRAVGHGMYFAAMVNGQLILDSDGKPIPTRLLPLAP